jgi:hypothetical protein
MKILFTTTVLFLSFLTAFSQAPNNINSFTPDEASKSITSGFSTDYYTGRLNYSVTLTTASIYGIKFPIGLTYSGGGIRVQDISGSAGLGWSSSAGGQITRAVNGLPDDDPYGYCGSQRTGGGNYGAMNKTYVQKITDGTYDSQPDQFFFSFLGYSGTFVLDPDGNPLLQSNQTGLKVVSSPFKRGVQSTNIFILQDQQGNKFFFTGINVTSCLSHGETSNRSEVYVSGWYLTKILKADNNEIDLTYALNYTNYTNYLNVRHMDGAGSTSCLGSSHKADVSYNENQDVSTQQVNLTSISGDGITINFGYNLLRTDLTNTYALTDISVNYRLAHPIQYKLNYDYFTSNDGTNTKRLKLNSISQIVAGGASKTPYSFYYNETVNLPARNSIKTDLLGFYNNNTTSSDLSYFADKTPNLTNAQANILTSVTSLLGGTTHFEYELNDYSLSGTTYTACGLRIKDFYATKSSSDPTVISKSMVSYTNPGTNNSSGQIYSYATDFRSLYSVQCTVNLTAGVYYYSSASLEALTDANGTLVGYSNVTVTEADGSSEQYTFTNFSDYPDKSQVQYYYDNTASVTFNPSGQTPIGNLPVSSGTSYAFARGKLLQEKLINSTGQAVRTTVNNYTLSAPQGAVIGIKSNLALIDAYNGRVEYQVIGYSYSTQDLQLTSKTVQDFNTGVSQQTTSETYTYTNFAPNLLKTRTVYGSGNKVDNYTLRYPFDVIPSVPTSAPASSLILTSMVYNNMIANPVEVIHSVVRNSQEVVTSVNLTQYGIYNNSYYPSRDYKLETNILIPLSGYTKYTVTYNGNTENNNLDTRLNLTNVYNNYDLQANLLQSESPAGTGNYTSNLYDYGNSYKIAVVKGAQQNDIAYTSFEADGKGNWAFSGLPDFDFAALTGKHSYNLSYGALSKGSLTPATTYILTYWTKNGSPFTVTGGTAILLASANGWNCYQHTITGQSGVTLSGTGIIDEVRLYPKGALMTTTAYFPFVGVASANDANNQVITYTYDEFNRLQYVRDNEQNIMKAYCYNSNGESGDCFNFLKSASKSGVFYKNNCGPGYVGSAVTYVVPAGRYSATTQQAANGLAQDDVDQNGQVYANNNGTCTAQSIYARVEMSNYTNPTTYEDQNNYGSQTIADVYVRLYSDASCTNPYVTPTPINVIVAEGYSSSTVYQGSDSGTNNVTFTVASGTSSYFIGNNVLSKYVTYTDPYTGSGSDTDSYNYTFDVVTNPAYYYIPANTQE